MVLTLKMTLKLHTIHVISGYWYCDIDCAYIHNHLLHMDTCIIETYGHYYYLIIYTFL
jgi:hypothetical protein